VPIRPNGRLLTTRLGADDLLGPRNSYLDLAIAVSKHEFRGPRRCGLAPAGGEDDELLGGPGHCHVAVDGSLDAYAKALELDENDKVEFEAFRPSDCTRACRRMPTRMRCVVAL